MIHITDNGIGFSNHYKEKIFDQFYRLHGKNSNYEGTGMGLAICKKIIQKMGGSINADSKVNEGSIFEIKLPIKELALQ